MRILSAPASAERIVHRSRFLGILEVVRDPEDARARLKDAKARFADATHVVHAFRTGPEGSETMGCSDDGEPSGTAGRPVLDVLKGAGGGSALLLIVRWYGGIQLGTGGLVKAYSETAKMVVGNAVWEESRSWVLATVFLPWAEHRPMVQELDALGAQIVKEDFNTGVNIEARIPAEHFDRIQQWTGDLTRGRTGWSRRE